ncbi:putative phospholipase A2 2 [Cocos nucifera]|uniref:Putative phospholipase A2 2 n=1 Tax=Cocos nucifera TaxID=13894 RepID=A0A8K0IY29_COCNU|nr:putative phospholipase A2 2 [Cocos nucifera]
MLWDRRPIDWLDFCCYCHDIGYDTHDQAKLLKADLAFLECLEKPRMATKGGAHVAFLYRAMCIAGLRYILIPYRMQLLRLQPGPSFVDVFGNLMSKVTMPGKVATTNHKERL